MEEKVMTVIRRARADEAQVLTLLAGRSEAYWGYDEAEMEKFAALYALKPEFISDCPTYVLEADGCVTGFYGILTGSGEPALEYLFIDPVWIGHGFGKLLWEHMLEECRALGITGFSLVTSPQAKAFYVKLGAVEDGEVASLVNPGRMVPRLRFDLK